jgi:glutaryl-CoA dehydrogenase
MAYAALDYYAIDELFSHEERLVRDTVRELVTTRVMPTIGQHWAQGTFPRELVAELGKLGLLGSSLTGYGCAGITPTAYGLVCQELERGDSGIRSFCSVQSSLVMYPIWAFGSEAQKQRYLPEMAAGRAIGCFGLTEPDSGSDPGSMRTRAVRDGDDWILTGNKMWITNGSIADVAVVWARTDEGVRGFLVERAMPGFSTQDVHHKISLRASITSELILDDVRVPESSRLPEGNGLKAPLGCLTEARFGIVWGVTGSARDALASTLDYATSRTQFGKPIAGFQLTQKKFADMAVALQQMQLTARRLGELKDSGRIQPHHISFGKFANVSGALAICREARSILGGSGITTEYPVLRHAVNLETVYTYEGTHEVHTLVIGSKLTGIDAFR